MYVLLVNLYVYVGNVYLKIFVLDNNIVISSFRLGILNIYVLEIYI